MTESLTRVEWDIIERIKADAPDNVLVRAIAERTAERDRAQAAETALTAACLAAEQSVEILEGVRDELRAELKGERVRTALAAAQLAQKGEAA